MLTSFFGWVLRTVTSAAEAEMDDDSVLREQLLDAEMRRELGEISDREFAEVEADLLARIREIRARREGGSDPFTMAAGPIEVTGGAGFEVEAGVTGDFHDEGAAPHTTIVERGPGYEEHVEVLPSRPRIAAGGRRPATGPAPAPPRRAGQRPPRLSAARRSRRP